MNLTKILTIALLAVSLYLAYYLYSGVQKTIDDRNSIATNESAVIERLKLIREAEIVFQQVNGQYTANWDSLATFIETGKVPIIERREEIIQKAYGGEDIIIHIDTLGFISAREKILKKNYTVSAADDGIFMGYKVKVGDQVITNQKAYAMKEGDKVNELPFLEKGTITTLANVSVGAAITRGQELISFWDYQFNPNVDVRKLSEKEDGTKYEIFAGNVDKSGVKVQVIEVVDPTPANPARKESNDHKNRKPLRFGSRIDVSTAGNWE
ncbi:MAG: hypothetical protein AABY93_18875 [Bacteroidota bacterium]